MPEYTISVNGNARTVNVEPDTPLLWVLRDELGLTGTKFGCGIGQCLSCAVHLDGEAVPSCLVRIDRVADRPVVTIEGLSRPPEESSHPVQRAWMQVDVPQCGWCQSGQIMTAAALLAKTPSPTDEQIDEAMSRVLCRCGTYARIRDAVHAAAKGGTR